MSPSLGYILVLDTESRTQRGDHPLSEQLQYPMVIADSVEQAVNHALRIPPSLVILIGDNVQNWSASLVSRLRQNTQAQNLTIVALTNSCQPSVELTAKIPPGLDGLLCQTPQHLTF